MLAMAVLGPGTSPSRGESEGSVTRVVTGGRF
jgi:hypothetical protein